MTLSPLMDMFSPGTLVHLPGATGEAVCLAEAIAADPERMAGVHVVSCLLPGMNAFDYAAAPDTQLTTFLLPAASRGAFAAGRVRLLPISYSEIGRYLASLPLDIAVAHVAPPTEDGRCSLGIAADFSPIAWARARRRVALINPMMPAVSRGPKISLTEADLVIEHESPLVEIAAATPDEAATIIARNVAELIPDRSVIQVGIGAAPAALWSALGSHRGLRLRSGMVGPEAIELADQGALAPDGHVAGIATGSRSFYNELAARNLVRFADVRETHDIAAIGQCSSFFACNSALEVDLLGQTNLEWQSGRPVSGVGGAPDFASGAMRSQGGCSIVMLPATARSGTVSRIVGRLTAPAVSLPRSLADVVVTEYGVAELRHASLDERAESLISIAEPSARDALKAEWRQIRRALD